MAAPSVLCVDHDQDVRERFCDILELAGHHSISASPKYAVILLSYKKFDLLVLSSFIDNFALNAIVSVAGGTKLLVLEPVTSKEQSLVTASNHVRRLLKAINLPLAYGA